jgi:hypothetical protein
MTYSSQRSANWLSGIWTAIPTDFRSVRSALARITDGSHGTCLHCEEEIKLKRLNGSPGLNIASGAQESFDRHELEADHGDGTDELQAPFIGLSIPIPRQPAAALAQAPPTGAT